MAVALLPLSSSEVGGRGGEVIVCLVNLRVRGLGSDSGREAYNSTSITVQGGVKPTTADIGYISSGRVKA